MYKILPLIFILHTGIIAQEYFPLEIGNKWEYESTTPMGEVIDTFSIEVLNDTVMSNDIKYFELSNDFGLGRFVRADSDFIYFRTNNFTF